MGCLGGVAGDLGGVVGDPGGLMGDLGRPDASFVCEQRILAPKMNETKICVNENMQKIRWRKNERTKKREREIQKNRREGKHT